MPEVSVIIPIYNTAAYLRKALDSICGQTLKELEIILIDDGSTDGSRGIIEEYAKTRRKNPVVRAAQPGDYPLHATEDCCMLPASTYIFYGQ